MTSPLQIQMILTPFLDGNAQLTDMLNAAEDLLKTPIRFAPHGDLQKAIVSRSYPSDDTDQVYAFYADRDNFDEARKKKEICLSYFSKGGPQLILDQATGRRKILGAVAVNGNHLGHVALPETDTDLRTLNLDAVAEVCRYIGLFMVIHSFRPAESSGNDLLKGMLSGTIDSRIHDKFLKYPNRWYRLYFIYGPQFGGSLFRDMEEQIHSVFPEDVSTPWENGMALLTSRDNRLLHEEDKALIRRILRDNISRCIVSPGFANIFDCREWIGKLQRILTVSDAKDGSIIEYDLCRADALFHKTSQAGQSLTPYVSEYVDEISLHDEKHGTHYLETLRAYFKCNRNYEMTADTLKVHVNTVQYRIRRMQELFEFQLDRSDIQFQFMLSLRILDLSSGR